MVKCRILEKYGIKYEFIVYIQKKQLHRSYEGVFITKYEFEFNPEGNLLRPTTRSLMIKVVH